MNNAQQLAIKEKTMDYRIDTIIDVEDLAKEQFSKLIEAVNHKVLQEANIMFSEYGLGDSHDE